MKHVRNIIPLILLLIVTISCGKDDPVNSNGQKVILDWPGFIWFDSDVKTKTTAIEYNMYGKDFNVIAFKYSADTDWSTFKATGTPASAMGTKGFKFPTTVSCASDGVCSYTSSDNTNPVEWEGTNKYSFFAYYPATSTDDPASTVSRASTNSTAGVPSIKYTVPAAESDGYMDATKVPDVMTAYATDAQNRGGLTGVVSLNFVHRLCLFCVEARNLKEADATISDLILTIESKRYGAVTIPLDGSPLQLSSTDIIEDNFKCRMQPTSGTGSSVIVEQFGKYGTSDNTLVSHPNNHIAFIPQDPDVIGEFLSGKLNFKWNGDDKEQEFSSTKVFKEGTKYAFVITIASNDAISIDIRESDEWIEKSNDIIFE